MGCMCNSLISMYSYYFCRTLPSHKQVRHQRRKTVCTQMTWKTHLVLGAMAGFYADPSWRGIAVGAVMALLPDIDKANSKVGRMARPLSRLVEKGIGHRTLTHSWVMLFVPALLFADPTVAHAALWGLLSHFISDALVGRIQFFWPVRQGWIGIPLSKNAYRMADKIVYYGALATIVYRGIQGGAEEVLHPFR